MSNPKADQVMAEASLVDLKRPDAGAPFVAGFFSGLQLAHRHPEAVGLVLDGLMVGPQTGRAMPKSVLNEAVGRADRIALAVEDGRTAHDRLEQLVLDNID